MKAINKSFQKKKRDFFAFGKLLFGRQCVKGKWKTSQESKSKVFLLVTYLPCAHAQLFRYRFVSMGTIALLAQITVMYIISVQHKSGREWRTDYTATWYALQVWYL